MRTLLARSVIGLLVLGLPAGSRPSLPRADDNEGYECGTIAHERDALSSVNRVINRP